MLALQPPMKGARVAIVRIMKREGDPEELERQYRTVSSRMDAQPLADGLIAHIALRSDNGIQIINVWETEAHSQAAFERPEFQEALREAGLTPADMQPEDYEALNVRTA